MRIIYKLTLGFVAVALLIALVGYFAGGAGQGALRQSIGGVSRRLARQLIADVDRHMYERIEQFQAYAKTRMLQETVARSNWEFEQLDSTRRYIDEKDAEWTGTPFMRELMENSLSKEFRGVVEFYRERYGYMVVGEVFVTNKYGANVAQSGRTTDYRQDDESWWHGAREEGVIVEDVEYDQSAGVYSTDIAIPIEDDDGEFVGVLKVVLNIQEAINIIREAQSRYIDEPRQARVYRLLSADKKLIYSTEEFTLFEDGSYLLPGDVDSPVPVYDTGTFVREDPEKGAMLCAYARSSGHREFEGLGWILLLEHDMRSRLAPAAELRERIWMTSLLVAVLGIAIGGAISVSLSKRIERLRKGTEIIGGGDLDHKVGTAARDEIGELSRAFDDMTERFKSTTISRDRLAEEVERREQVEEQLRETMAELKRSNEELEQFAYVASHDLQQPLRLVTSYVELLAKRYRGELDTDADEFIGFALDSAQRMQGLIKDLLAYSRVETVGKAFADTSCEEALDRALMNLRPVIEETSAQVTHDPLPSVVGDELQLVQLFQNLVGNAIKFRGEEVPKVHVGAQRRNGGWLFSVEDNGIGMNPKHAERIFLVFQRLHTRAEYKGTGIGLAICKKIVEHHGGRIWVESKHGQGSTFYFTLPGEEGDQ
jgi:signal transduction histidine kinase